MKLKKIITVKGESGNLKLFKKENKMTNELKNGTKVRVVAGDRDTVLHDPYGTLENIDVKNNKVEVHLTGCYFNTSLDNIGEGKDIILLDN